MHGRRTALRYSPSTPSPAGARPRGRSTVLPFGSGVARSIAAWRAGGGAWGGEACSWVCSTTHSNTFTLTGCVLQYMYSQYL